MDRLLQEARCYKADPGVQGTVLGMLYDTYAERSSNTNQEIQHAFKALSELLGRTHSADAEEIANTVCDLCREHEKSGFIDGVCLGIRLAQEANIK